jgi:shikimate kinase
VARDVDAPPAGLIVALVGMMGSGKSAVGEAVARGTGRTFVDLDRRIEAAAGRTIGDLFATRGESGFREIEVDELRSALATSRPSVVATGGGVVTTAEARELLGLATVVWLDADIDTLVERVGDAADRPLLAGDPRGALEMLQVERRPLYAEVADIVVDVSTGTVDEVAGRVMGSIGVGV